MSGTAEKPFLYLATLRRSGSKMLSKALSLPPHGFVFREVGLPRANFNAKEAEIWLFRAMGVDIAGFQEKYQSLSRKKRLIQMRDELFPQLLEHVDQIGIKEIRNVKWERVADTIPNIRAVVLARDPRDIYLSLVSKFKRTNRLGWNEDLYPAKIAEYIAREFGFQQGILRQLRSVAVRYEDLCFEPRILDSIRVFCESDVPAFGIMGNQDAGVFKNAPPEALAALKQLMDSPDAEHHGPGISTKAIGRWVSQSDPDLRAKADLVFDLLPEYVDFWGYKRDEPVTSARQIDDLPIVETTVEQEESDRLQMKSSSS